MTLKRKELPINLLNPMTFWDVELNALDKLMDKDFILVRVLERGRDAEIQYIESLYSQQDITAALEKTKGVSKRTLNFYKNITL